MQGTGSYLCWLVHGYRCTAGCEAHMNFSNESACLMAKRLELREIINFVD
jgi:hypothetical protein